MYVEEEKIPQNRFSRKKVKIVLQGDVASKEDALWAS